VDEYDPSLYPVDINNEHVTVGISDIKDSCLHPTLGIGNMPCPVIISFTSCIVCPLRRRFHSFVNDKRAVGICLHDLGEFGPHYMPSCCRRLFSLTRSLPPFIKQIDDVIPSCEY
jgi:hypothetical protein